MTTTDIKQGLTNIKLIVSMTIICLIVIVVASIYNSYQIRVFYDKSCDNTLTLRDTTDNIVTRAARTSQQNPNYTPAQKAQAAIFYAKAHVDLQRVACK